MVNDKEVDQRQVPLTEEQQSALISVTKIFGVMEGLSVEEMEGKDVKGILNLMDSKIPVLSPFLPSTLKPVCSGVRSLLFGA